MGVINTTPDSFSDGGQFATTEAAFDHALTLIDQGADILDIGGESTRPGAERVSAAQEMDRVIPLIERLRAESDIAISVDSYKPEVMQSALAAGADMLNDVNGLRAPGALSVAADAKVPVCIMHMQGQPQDMQNAPHYDRVLDEVMGFFDARIKASLGAGMQKDDLILDPGIGFGKTLEHNLTLLKALPTLQQSTGCEVLIGVSRKSMIDALFGRPVEARLPASLGLAVQAVLNGAKIVRVHDVRATFDAVRSVEAVLNA